MENKNSNDFSDEIDLKELFGILWQEKRIIISITSFISILGVIYSLLLPNLYVSSAVLSTSSPNGISKSLQSYAGLAGLAGVTLPSSTSDDNTSKAIAKLTSLSFFSTSIMPNIFLPDLMAVESWDRSANKLNYDESIYNADTNVWTKNPNFDNKQAPSIQESFEVFKNKHFGLSENKDTGFITLTIKHQSPYIAKDWVEVIIKEINYFYRQKDKSDSEKAINYLNRQIALTNLAEIKEAISQIIQDETRRLALVEAKEYYVFEYIDTPVVKEKKSEPKRAIICILISFLGGMLSIIYVLLKHYVFKEGAT